MHLTRFAPAFGLSVLVGAASLVSAGNLCVSPGGQKGCFTTIGAAVAQAQVNDTVYVGPGTYKEDVVIGSSISLIGAGAERAIIDATGLANGINVDGYNHPGLSNVNVQGFTVKNANFEGILITNASHITVANSHVTGNDRSLQFTQNGPACPGLPAYFAAFQGFDCGEGIHLSGVAFSTIANNVVDKNSGGILLSDDTGGTHDNLISGNQVVDNPYDCSITLASHHFSMSPDPTWAVYHNTVSGNTSSRNGLKTDEGAGVGIFAAPPGAQNYGNVIINNRLTGNGLPGVAMHSHSPLQNLNDNLIAGNFISGNGPDSDPGTTVPTGIVVFSDEAQGAPPITGTRIIGNTIRNEGIDIAVKTSGAVDVRFNLLGSPVGVANLGSGSVDATLNWWSCPGGPGANGCAIVDGSGVQFAPWLNRPGLDF